MFPEQRYGRRLHALIASFLGIGYPRAHGQAGKSIVGQHGRVQQA